MFRRRQDRRDLALRQLDLPEPADLAWEICQELEGVHEAAVRANQTLTRLFARHGSICASCEGACCFGGMKRWKLPDLYLVQPASLTRCSTTAGQSYGELLRGICNRLAARLLSGHVTGPRRDCSGASSGLHEALQGAVPRTHCDHLVPGRGCRLAPDRRPTVCRIWLCKPLRRALGRDGMSTWRSCVAVLERCESDTVRVLHCAFGHPGANGVCHPGGAESR